jgi:hypothetical protein
MKKTLFLATLLSLFGTSFVVSQSDARRKKKKAKKGNSNTAQAIKALQGKFKFLSTRKDVSSLLKKQIKSKYLKKIVKTSGDLAKDNVRKLMNKTVYKLRKNLIQFKGKKLPWDTSIIDDQYAHKNNESMVAYIDQDEQKFFFFFNNQLYKIFISLPSKQFQGYNFAKFQMVMEKSYGKAKEVFVKGLGGETELHHLLWKGTGGVELWAMDKTDVYGNFIFILVNANVQAQAVASRKSRGVRVPSAGDDEINPLVLQVTKGTYDAAPKKKKEKK